MEYGEGVTSEILRSRAPLLQNRREQHEELPIIGTPSLSYLGVPILQRDAAIGVISVQSIEEEGRFGEAETRLLATIHRRIRLHERFGNMCAHNVVRGQAHPASVGLPHAGDFVFSEVETQRPLLLRILCQVQRATCEFCEPEATHAGLPSATRVDSRRSWLAASSGRRVSSRSTELSIGRTRWRSQGAPPASPLLPITACR